MGKFYKSNGESISKEAIDRKDAKAKNEYSEEFLSENGYYFCERCKGNINQCPGISRSHIISKKECQNTGRAELAYSKTNYELLGDECHRDIENWSAHKRDSWYFERLNGVKFEDFIADFENENP